MFGNLIPWKARSGQMRVHHDDHPIARLRQDFDRLWDTFLTDWHSGELSLWDDVGGFGAGAGLEDRGDQYLFRAELPGFEPQDFDLKVSGNLLTLRAEHRDEGQGEHGYHRYGSFYQSFTLPDGVLADQISARYHSGVLEVRLPKHQDVQGRRIEVKAA